MPNIINPINGQPKFNAADGTICNGGITVGLGGKGSPSSIFGDYDPQIKSALPSGTFNAYDAKLTPRLDEYTYYTTHSSGNIPSGIATSYTYK